MIKSKIFKVHFFCWLAYILYFFLGDYLIFDRSLTSLALKLSLTFVRVVEFYICFLWIYPFYLKKNKIPQLIIGILFALAVFIALRYLIEEVLFLSLFGFHNYYEGTTIKFYIFDNIYYGSSYIILAAAAWAVQNSFQKEQQNLLLKDEVKKAELSFLKAQINPHFLYNTLNYIYAMAIPISEKLSDAILKLSDLMRYTLDESKDGIVHLNKEVGYLKSYIELFKMRFEPNFYVNFETAGVSRDQKVPQLLLIAFVENALKHGVVNEPEHPVKIILKVQHARLSFEVSNKINRTYKDSTSGIGLINVQRRLDLIYPDRHELLISNNGNTYKTTLIIHL